MTELEFTEMAKNFPLTIEENNEIQHIVEVLSNLMNLPKFVGSFLAPIYVNNREYKLLKKLYGNTPQNHFQLRNALIIKDGNEIVKKLNTSYGVFDVEFDIDFCCDPYVYLCSVLKDGVEVIHTEEDFVLNDIKAEIEQLAYKGQFSEYLEEDKNDYRDRQYAS